MLEPFVRAGLVKYRQRSIHGSEDRVAPLSECIEEYQERHRMGDHEAPRWVVLVDADEYIWSGDLVTTLSEVLAMYSDTCCLKVSPVAKRCAR